MTVKQLNDLLEELDLNYYESGAYYDTPREKFDEIHRERIEKEHNLSLIEF